MSIALATKGVIAQYVIGGGGGTYPSYVPVDTPDMLTEEVGEVGLYPTMLQASIRSIDLVPSIGTKELKPKIKAE